MDKQERLEQLSRAIAEKKTEITELVNLDCPGSGISFAALPVLHISHQKDDEKREIVNSILGASDKIIIIDPEREYIQRLWKSGKGVMTDGITEKRVKNADTYIRIKGGEDMDANNRETLKSTGEILKTRRIELKLSRPKLAKMVGKTESSIKRYELGKLNIPFSVLVDICNALDMDVIFLRGKN